MLQSKNSTATKYFLLLFILVIFGLTACDDGDDGRDGQPGPPGPAGPPAGVDPGNAGEIIADITNVSIASPPVVDFTLSDENGNPVVGLPASSISFTIAKLVPGTDGNASAWQSYINRTEDPGGVGPGTETEIQAATENGGDGVLDEITNGIYQYTFATDVANVTDPIAVVYDPNLTHRVGFEIRGFGAVINPVYTFLPADGSTSGLFSREIVNIDTCNGCHEELALHGGGRFETQYCVTCHNPGSIDANSTNTVDFKVMVHKIHRGRDLPSVIMGEDYCIYGFFNSLHCYGDVGFPQDIRNCENCHTGSDPVTPDGDNWYMVPTAEACGSCHDDVDFETGANHAGGAQSNSACTSCHAANTTSGLGAYQKHRILTDEDAERYSLNILTIDFMGPGLAPDVTFSITDPTNGDMPYDLANDADLTNGSTSFRFYLGWPTTDFTNSGNSNSGASSTNVYSAGVLQAMDNGDFTYTLTLGIVPANVVGSGIVGFVGQVTNANGSSKISNQHEFFGITDDPMNPTPRRMNADIDRCNVCHVRMTNHNDRINNIYVCSTCHNSSAARGSGGPMDIKSFIHRKHAVDDITYPQRVSNCLACHTDDGFYPIELGSGILSTSVNRGADSFDLTDNNRQSPNAGTCSVCHSDATAEVHMEQNGASFDACEESDGTLRVRVDACGPGGDKSGAIVQESCTVCHDAGRSADVAVMHNLDLD